MFQTWITQKIGNYLGKELQTEIKVGGVDIEWFHTLVLEDIYIGDQKENKLAQFKKLKLSGFEQTEDKLVFSDLVLVEPHFHLKRYQDSTKTNMQFLIDYFKSPEEDSLKTPKEILSNSIQIENGIFEYENFNSETESKSPIDFNSLYIEGIDLQASDLYNLGDSLKVNLEQINFNEKSGFELQHLEGLFEMNNKTMLLSNAKIQSNESDIDGNIEMKYKSFRDFASFNKRVKLDIDLNESNVQLADVAYFSNNLVGINRNIDLKGRLYGKVNNLKAKDLDMKFDENSNFKGNFSINGLPNFSESFITLDVEELTTNYADLKNLPLPPFDGSKSIPIPDNFRKLGQMNFTGHFTGFTFDFAAYGDLKTNLGNLKSDLSLNQNEYGEYSYNGNIKSQGFDIGEFYEIDELERVYANLNVQGNGIQLAEIDAKIKGKITEFQFNDYAYTNIDVDGTLKEKYFNGDLIVKDENLWMDFNGEVDLNNKPPKLGFTADVQNIDFVDLNFFDFHEYSCLSAKVTANAVGSNLENIVGDIRFDELTYCIEGNECKLDSILIHSELNNGVRRIETNSSIVSGSLEGSYNFKDLPHSVELILESVIPSYVIPHKKNHELQNFVLDMEILDFDIVRDFFLPDYSVAPNTRIHLKVDEIHNDLELTGTSDSISILGIRSEGVTVDTRKADSTLFFTLLSDTIHLNDQISMKQFSLDGRSESDTLYTSLDWNTPDEFHYGQLSGRYVIRGAKNLDYYFDRSLIAVQNDIWNFNKNASVNIDSTRIQVNDFNISRGLESIVINGVISEAKKSKLNVVLNNLELNHINPWINELDKTFNGEIDGSLTIQDFYDERLVFSDLDLTEFMIDDYEIGDIHLESEWENEFQRIRTKGNLLENGLEPVAFEGYYSPKDKENPVDLLATVDELDLSFINSFIKEAISDIGGTISGTFEVHGKVEEPLLNGEMYLNKAHLTVDYLNTTYYFEDKVTIYEDLFAMAHIPITDQEGNKGFANGGILHENFTNWDFDLFADVSKNKFLCLNTTEEMNDLYYGKAYGTGYISASGYAKNLELEISMQTSEGTDISMPMGNSTEVAFEDFVVFVDKDAPVVEEEKIDLSGISMNFELDILPNADFKIIFDEAIGDVMQGKGEGRVNMNIDTRGTFEMFGNVELTEGDYKFVLKNLINKDFTVIPGGTISWYGDPLDANINIETVYHLTAPLYDLLGDLEANYKNRTAVDLQMELKGELFSPAITFDIEIPNVDELTKSRVNSIINSDDEMNRQAFALIVLRRFVSPPNISSNHSNTLLSENGSEFISSQLSSWLSQISNDFDLGINYRPGDEITNQEIAIALSTQFFNDKLSVSGNFGVSQGNEVNQNPNSLIGDIRLEYVVDDEGKIRLVMFNRSNDFDIASSNQNASTQGAGLLYREEFDSMEEFYCAFKNLFLSGDNEQPCD